VYGAFWRRVEGLAGELQLRVCDYWIIRSRVIAGGDSVRWTSSCGEAAEQESLAGITLHAPATMILLEVVVFLT
jgi:hypothetical protein